MPLLGSVFQRPGQTVMLYFFLDDSGTDERSPVITMAGYVALAHNWAIFGKRAKKLYARYGITQLHASDYHGTKGEFAGWGREKKMQFVREMFELVRKSCVLGVKADIHNAPELAALVRHGVSFRVEKGNKNNPDIKRPGHDDLPAVS